MTKKNPSVLWSVDQHKGVNDIGEDGRLKAQTNIGIGGIVSTVSANKFVTGMKRTSSNDLEYVSAQPALSDLVAATKDRSVVTDHDTGAITVADLSYASPSVPSTGTNTSLEFIDTVSQGSTGKISATKKAIPKSDATDSDNSNTLATSKAVYSIATSLSSHTHGNITNDGKIVTGANGVLTTGATDGTYDSSTNPIATQSTVTGAINGLAYSDSAVTNQFVTSVSESNGIISVNRAQPSIGDLATVASDKRNYSIGTNSSDGKIEAQNLTVSSATDGGDSDDLTFVSSVTQASNGKIAVTTKKVPYSIQFIDTSYTYDQVTELIAAGKYPVLRYQNGYDTLYLPMFTAPSNSGTDIEFRGFAKNTASSVYKIVCDYETGFGELTSTAFVSTEDARNFIDNVTFDASVGDNLPGSVTLKYHKYNADYTGIITLSGDQGSGMGIRTVTPTQSPYAYRIVNLRPVPAYPTTYKDRILSVNSSGDGLEWRALANADWNATSGPSQILNKPTITSIQYKSYGGDPTDVDTLLIDADDPEGYVRVGTSGNTMGLLVEGPYKTLLNSGINDGSGVGDENTPVYIKSDGTFDTCLTRSDVDFISFNYSDPNPQDNVYDAIVAARANNRLPVLYCGMGGSTAYWVFSGEGSIGYSFSRNTSASCSRATIGPDHAFSITEQLIAAGDVVGPSSADNNHIPLYDGTTGKLIKNSKFYFTDEAQADTAEAAKQV